MLFREEVVRLAVEYAEDGFLCSEAVSLALSKGFGVPSDVIPRVATGFAAGIGREGEMCGAVSGGIIGLGLPYGRSVAVEPKDGRRPYWYSTELLDTLRERWGRLRCGDLLGLDLSKPEGLRVYRERGLWATRCRELIKVAAGVAFDIARAGSMKEGDA